MTEEQKEFMNQTFQANPKWDRQWAYCFIELEDSGEIGNSQSFMLTWQIRAVIGALLMQQEMGKPIAEMTPADVVAWVKDSIPFDCEAFGVGDRIATEKEERRTARRIERETSKEPTFQ